MNMIDTNVLLDIIAWNPIWVAWSKRQLDICLIQGKILINPIIYAELAPAFPTMKDLDSWLDSDLFEKLPLPYESGWLASQAFVRYRRAGGTKNAPLPDFFIGAHAALKRYTLVTRDPARYQTYFPSVNLVSPP
jgi:predicted nucleic acid-binding protein